MKLVVSALVLLAGTAAYAAQTEYLALGDSIAFGYQPVGPGSMPSFADQGYVGGLDTFLANLNGGVKPVLKNLALVGETSSSFFDTSLPTPNRLGNLNYTSIVSQDSLASSVLASDGSKIKYVSFALGSNDFLQLIPDDFATLPFVQQVAVLQNLANDTPTILASIQTSYTTELTEIRTDLPTATLLLPGYYNPFDVLPATNPLRQISDVSIGDLNQLIKGEAKAFDGRYVDFSAAINPTNVATDTWILEGDVHPNDAGYAALTAQVRSAVPAPPSAFVAMAAAGLAFLRRRKNVS